MPLEKETRKGIRLDLPTRRGVLRNGGCLLGGALMLPSFLPKTLWGETHPTATPVSDVMATLSDYMAGARLRSLPANIQEATKNHILDTFAAMISGTRLPPGLAALRFAKEYGGEHVATVVGSNMSCGPLEAALTNGVLAHSDETDDSHSPSQSHPGCSVVPAALAAGQRYGISGAEFIRAVTLGYDIGTRVGIALGAVNYQVESHRDPHASSGNFGSAAAAGCAASLNPNQMRWLMDYAAQQCSGISAWQRDTQHMEKAFTFAGMTARNGVTAAMLVQTGWTGVDDVFSGPDNFFMAYAPHANAHDLIDQLGTRFEVMNTNIKKWSVGSPIQAPLDALESIMQQHPFEPAQVKEVVVRVATREASIVDNRELPDICLQHLLAVMLLQKTVTFRSAHDETLMRNPEVMHERSKILLVPDEALQARLPAREAIVQVTLENGEQFSRHITAVRGTAQNPMTMQEVKVKARDLIEPILGQAGSGRLIESVLQLETIRNLRDLGPLLQPHGLS